MNLPPWFEAGVDSDLQVLREDGERIFCRIKRDLTDGDHHSVLALLLAAEHPTPASLNRLTNEYALENELDDAWAVRPLKLVRERGRRAQLKVGGGGGAHVVGLQRPGRRPAGSLPGPADGDRKIPTPRHRSCS